MNGATFSTRARMSRSNTMRESLVRKLETIRFQSAKRRAKAALRTNESSFTPPVPSYWLCPSPSAVPV